MFQILLCIELIYISYSKIVSTLLNFVLVMILFPEVQYAAQEELDRVVSRSRLPGMEDEKSLPYITALRKEVMRCVAVTCSSAYLDRHDKLTM
jgi:hypothetical protein